MSNSRNATISDPFVIQLGYLNSILRAQTGDLDQEESLFQPPEGANCINWIVGHIVTSRNELLELLGRPPIWDAELRARYGQGSPPVTEAGPGVADIGKLVADYDATQEPILEALAAITAEELAVKVPWFGGELDKSGAIAGFLFHEAYHVGQTGLVRRLLGRASAVGI